MNKIVIFPTTSLKTIAKNLSPSFKVVSFDEEKRYITIRQLEKKSTQTFKLASSRTYLLSEDNSSLKIERIHIFKNRENKHFLSFKYTNPIDFQIWVKEYTNATISAINFYEFSTKLTYLNNYNNRVYPLLLPTATYYCLYCLETGIISTVSSVTFEKNFH